MSDHPMNEGVRPLNCGAGTMSDKPDFAAMWKQAADAYFRERPTIHWSEYILSIAYAAGAAAQASRGEGQQQWRDIATAPKDGAYILLLFKGPFQDVESPGVAVGRYYDKGYWWLTAIWASSVSHQQPTHWQPLPPPPPPAQE